MEPDCGTDTRQAGRSRPHWRRQSTFCRCHRVDGANGSSVARSLTVLRELEQRVQAIPPMGKGWCLGAYSGGFGGPRFGVSDHRWDDHPGAPTCSRRKRGIQEQAIGRSRGGLSTKIHIAVDALGNVLRLLYTAGQTHESTTAEALIAGLPAQNILGDKAFDSDRFRAHLVQRNMTAVIPSNASRARAIPYDAHLYKTKSGISSSASSKKSSIFAGLPPDMTRPSHPMHLSSPSQLA